MKLRPGWLQSGDQRSKVYRELLFRLSEFADQFGGMEHLSPVQRTLLERVVHVEALLGQMEAKARAGEPIDVGRYCALIDRLHGIGRTLGIHRTVRPTKTLADVIREQQMEEQNTPPSGPPAARQVHTDAATPDGAGHQSEGEAL